jgi:HPt (histidine-containing phosphotransfer) domain-containing protein
MTYTITPPTRDERALQIKSLQTLVANQKLHIAALEAALAEKDAKIQRLQELVRDQDDAIRAAHGLKGCLKR